MKRRWLVILVVIAAAGVAAFAWMQFKPQGDPNRVRVSGNVEVTDVEVGFRIPGWVEARSCLRG